MKNSKIEMSATRTCKLRMQWWLMTSSRWNSEITSNLTSIGSFSSSRKIGNWTQPLSKIESGCLSLALFSWLNLRTKKPKTTWKTSWWRASLSKSSSWFRGVATILSSSSTLSQPRATSCGWTCRIGIASCQTVTSGWVTSFKGKIWAALTIGPPDWC